MGSGSILHVPIMYRDVQLCMILTQTLIKGGAMMAHSNMTVVCNK